VRAASTSAGFTGARSRRRARHGERATAGRFREVAEGIRDALTGGTMTEILARLAASPPANDVPELVEYTSFEDEVACEIVLLDVMRLGDADIELA
jgi:hypothetical protein